MFIHITNIQSSKSNTEHIKGTVNKFDLIGSTEFFRCYSNNTTTNHWHLMSLQYSAKHTI